MNPVSADKTVLPEPSSGGLSPSAYGPSTVPKKCPHSLERSL